jgi:hypothetical protein
MVDAIQRAVIATAQRQHLRYDIRQRPDTVRFRGRKHERSPYAVPGKPPENRS